MGRAVTRPASSTRPRATFALLGIAAYLAAGTFAAIVYPGGTHWDPQSVGSGLTTFWCDLLRPVALNGQDNSIGARAAQIALLALALGLGPFFSLACTLLDVSEPRRSLLLVCSAAGRMALILVAAGTGRLPPLVHDWAILIGAPFGLIALTLVISWTLPRQRWIALVGLGGLGLGAWNLIQYAREAVLHTPSWPGLPVVQKGATFGVLCFIALLSARGLRRDSTAVGSPS